MLNESQLKVIARIIILESNRDSYGWGRELWLCAWMIGRDSFGIDQVWNDECMICGARGDFTDVNGKFDPYKCPPCRGSSYRP